jgi:hypothetical protein
MKCNQLHYHPYVIVNVDKEMNKALDYSKLIEICGGETDDEENDTKEIVATLSEG